MQNNAHGSGYTAETTGNGWLEIFNDRQTAPDSFVQFRVAVKPLVEQNGTTFRPSEQHHIKRVD